MVPGIKSSCPETWGDMTHNAQTQWVQDYIETCSEVTLLEGAHRQQVCAGDFEGGDEFQFKLDHFVFRIVDRMPKKYMWLFGTGKLFFLPIPGCE